MKTSEKSAVINNSLNHCVFFLNQTENLSRVNTLSQ